MGSRFRFSLVGSWMIIFFSGVFSLGLGVFGVNGVLWLGREVGRNYGFTSMSCFISFLRRSLLILAASSTYVFAYSLRFCLLSLFCRTSFLKYI